MAEDGSKNNLEVYGSLKGIVGDISGGTVNQYIVSNEADNRIKQRKLIKESPYKGLDKFEVEDKDKFFGRDQLIASLSKDLERNSLLLLLGASGSGKSSLVRAGLIPKFLDKNFVNLTFMPDEDPFESLYGCLISKYGVTKAKIAQKGEADTLIQVVRELKKDAQWLIFIDQFEELFTISQKAKRDKFIDSLIQLIEVQDNSIKIVLTMRADFLDKISPYSSLVSIYNSHSQLLADMSPSDLRLAIAEPAARNGVVFQEGLLEQIINDFQGQAGSLPLLQYTLNLLWEKDDITDRILKTQTYYNLGRVTGALQQQANKVYDELLPLEQQAARQIFIDLVDVVGGKAVSRRADKANFHSDVLERTLNKLISNRLLVVSKQEKQKPTVAVAHEALLTSWQALQNWIKEAEETIVLKNRLIDDAIHWSNLRTKEPQKADGELWSGSKLERVIELREQPNFSNLSAEAKQFIDASVAWRDEERQRELEQERKARKAAQMRNRVAAISLIGLTGLTGFAFYQWNDAQNNTINALAQTSEASLLSNRQLEAMVSAIQAGRRLKNPMFPNAALKQAASTALQRAVYNVQERNRLEGRSDSVSSVAFSTDGKTIASGNRDNSVKLWDVARGEEIATLNGHSDPAMRVVFSPDGKTLASASADKTVKLWDVTTGQVINTLNGHNDVVDSVVFSPDGKTLASGSWDKTVKLWDVATGKAIAILNGHSAMVFSVGFSPDGKTLASGSDDKSVKLWDVATGKAITTLNGHSAMVFSVGFSPDGKTLASGSGDKTIKLWDVTTGKAITTLNGHSDAIWSVVFSSDGKTLASGSGDKSVKLWDVATGKAITALNGHSDLVNSVAFTPDGKMIASGSRDNSVKLWDVTTGKAITTLNGHSKVISSVGFSPDGKTLASGSADSSVKLWDVTTGQVINTLNGHSARVTSVVFSPDGKTIASGSWDKTVKLWDVATGKAITTLNGHNNMIWSVAFSPDGKTLASGSADKTVRLWDVATGKAITTFNGHSDAVFSVGFSPDGKTIASGGVDNSVKLWDVATGKEIATLNEHSNLVSSVAFSPDGKMLASGSWDKTVKLWNFYPNDLDDSMTRSCEHLRGYLQTNPNVSDRDRHLCDGIR